MGKKVDLTKKNSNSNLNTRRNNRNFMPRPRTNNQSQVNSDQQYGNDGENDGTLENNTSSSVSDTLANGQSNDNSTSGTITKVMKNPIARKAILISIPIILGVVIAIGAVAVIVAILGVELSSDSIAFGGYHNARCNEMTVIFVDPEKDYEVTGSETYSLEDYVAGVVYAEVGGFNNKEVYKTYALAARTFGLKHASEDCSIEGSARRQAFYDITEKSGSTVDLIYEAVRETAGQVIYSNNELYSVQYDAFCYINKDSQYYTLSQQNQKIPVDWVNNNISSYGYKNCPCDENDKSRTDCWDDGHWTDGGHGRGMSQYGALYLATEKGYTYDQILGYYYGDEISISTTEVSTNFINIADLEIKDTTKATSLNTPINQFLNSKGSSVESLNEYIHQNVNKVGAGTRAGVITSAVSLINYLYDNYNVKLPYYWGGKVSSDLIPESFGNYSPSEVSRGGTVYYYKSFDCSGFVSWAIRTGGYNFSNQSTVGFDSSYSKNSCNITDSSCVGQPGDLINSRSGHVELIIAVDKDNGKYFIAHSGNQGVTVVQRQMHKSNGGSYPTKIIFMEDFYSNQSNVNYNY